MRNIISKLPEVLSESVTSLPEGVLKSVEELRLNIGQNMIARSGTQEIKINSQIITKELLESALNNLLNYSIYAYEEELANGYVTIEGGHRVGICGRTVTENGKVTLIKDISSINIRHSRQIPGAAHKVMEYISDSNIGLQNTVIVSPPRCGKTTLLRDIIRVLSESGQRVGVCDERSELAGMYCGRPSYDIGPRTDVLDGCPKAEGMIMLIRSMAPDVIVTDEIGKEEDIRAIRYAVSSGVKVITTIHGNDYRDLISSGLGSLVEQRIFTRVIFLTNIPATGTVCEVRCV